MKLPPLNKTFADITRGRKILVHRDLVAQCMETLLTATGQMKNSEVISFALLPEETAFYIVEKSKIQDEERLVCTAL